VPPVERRWREHGNRCAAQRSRTLRGSLILPEAVKTTKPDGDIVEAALARAGAAPDEALVLGDTPYDVEAARRIGVGTVALRSGGWDDGALARAVAIYADASELLERYAASPFRARAGERT
jgi:phosphoglycolate phosphatase-like HAD superfamily hydrolase